MRRLSYPPPLVNHYDDVAFAFEAPRAAPNSKTVRTGVDGPIKVAGDARLGSGLALADPSELGGLAKIRARSRSGELPRAREASSLSGAHQGGQLQVRHLHAPVPGDARWPCRHRLCRRHAGH